MEGNREREERWFIDFREEGRRSIIPLIASCLCPKHAGVKEASEMVNKIKECCSKKQGFITGRMPIMECVFRLLLACGNEPLSLKEIGERLSELRGDTYRTSPEILSRLLESDHYYGIRKLNT